MKAYRIFWFTCVFFPFAWWLVANAHLKRCLFVNGFCVTAFRGEPRVKMLRIFFGCTKVWDFTKWWCFRMGISPKFPKDPGLGIIVPCPDNHGSVENYLKWILEIHPFSTEPWLWREEYLIVILFFRTMMLHQLEFDCLFTWTSIIVSRHSRSLFKTKLVYIWSIHHRRVFLPSKHPSNNSHQNSVVKLSIYTFYQKKWFKHPPFWGANEKKNNVPITPVSQTSDPTDKGLWAWICGCFFFTLCHTPSEV